MKGTLYSINGEKKSEISLPVVFDTKVREDLALKYFEADKFANMQPYSHDPEAGKKHSASGTISHRRHEWKGHYGKGMARIPRKVMWRRGTQFFWIGAEVSSTRGGRRAHGPTLFKKSRKINKKEVSLALNSGFAATANKNWIINRYSRIDKLDLGFPIVVESNSNMKAKDFLAGLEKIFGNLYPLLVKNKEVRAGKGKTRGRKYKSNAGLLLVKASDEKLSLKVVDVVSVNQIKISDLYPLGRLTIYTQKAINEMAKEKLGASK